MSNIIDSISSKVVEQISVAQEKDLVIQNKGILPEEIAKAFWTGAENGKNCVNVSSKDLPVQNQTFLLEAFFAGAMEQF